MSLQPRGKALASGEPFYVTGKPCKYGHIAERYTSSGECTVCEQERRDKAAEKRREQAAAWYARNKDRKLRESAKWYQQNLDRACATRGKWRSENKHITSALHSRRRARKLQASPPWGRELTDFVDAEAAHLAKLREQVTGFRWVVDHMIPLQCKTACGLHTWSNLQVIPHDMNLRKFNRLELTEPGEWIRRIKACARPAPERQK